VVLVTSVVWTALLSAWYPPTKPDPDTSDKESVASGAEAAAAAATATK
jgi:hypothetical protein